MELCAKIDFLEVPGGELVPGGEALTLKTDKKEGIMCKKLFFSGPRGGSLDA